MTSTPNKRVSRPATPVIWLACALVSSTLAACGPSVCGGEEGTDGSGAREIAEPRAETPASPQTARRESMPRAPAAPPSAGVREPARQPAPVDRDAPERIRALEEAAARGGSDVAPLAEEALEEALRERDSALAEAAIETLEEVGGREAVDALGRVLESDADTDLKLRALDGLELLDEPGAADRIALGLRADDKRVRERAAEALGLLDDPAAIRPLWDALDREQDEWVRETILDSLELLGEDVERYYEER